MGARGRRFLGPAFGLALLVGSGCAAIVGIEDTTTVDPPSLDAAADRAPALEDVGARDEPAPEDPDIIIPPDDQDAALPDEDEDAGGGPDASTCTLGAREAYVPAVSGVVSDVCNENGALSQGGSFAGLDCHGVGVHTISGKSATACVGIDYGTANLASASIRLFSVDKGCLYTCYAGLCGDKMTAHVFAGTSRSISTWKYLGSVETKRSAAVFRFALPAGDWSVLGICRSGAGAANDDVAVDGVFATCR